MKSISRLKEIKPAISRDNCGNSLKKFYRETEEMLSKINFFDPEKEANTLFHHKKKEINVSLKEFDILEINKLKSSNLN